MIGTDLVRVKNVYKNVFNPIRRGGVMAPILLSSRGGWQRWRWPIEPSSLKSTCPEESSMNKRHLLQAAALLCTVNLVGLAHAQTPVKFQLDWRF